jgi:predicted amidohydrolase
MSRVIRVAGAQMGPNSRADSRNSILARMMALLEQAAARGAGLVVFPELPFTTFFPRWLLSEEELDAYYEDAMPNPRVQALFNRARALQVGLQVGYAERTPEGRRFNSAILVTPDGDMMGKYRKIHLPGSVPAAGEALFRLWRPGTAGISRASPVARRDFGHADLQRSPLAGSVARAGLAGCGTGLHRL